MTDFDQKFADFLVKSGIITDEQKTELVESAHKRNMHVDRLAVEMDYVTDEQAGVIGADIHGIPFVRLRELTIKKEVIDLIPAQTAKDHKIVPLGFDGETLVVATNDPSQKLVFQFLEKSLKKSIRTVYAAYNDLKSALKVYETPLKEKLKHLKEGLTEGVASQNAESITEFLNEVIRAAADENASDIHFEPAEKEVLVRFRIDGILHDILNTPLEYYEVILSRVKVMAHLRTDEHRRPQDGRIKVDFEDSNLSIRVSIIPVYDGEKTVLRLLANQVSLSLEALGFGPSDLEQFHSAITNPHGMILVTGPTGSGKTTTLYSLLRILNKRERNISTIEDPIEIRLQGVNQVQVNPSIDLTFATGLRSLLRQDPDVLLVGEIRDEETAQIAMNAALTGHLVLATLHANDSISSIPRLLEMGAERFLIASTVNVAGAQRLVRRLCGGCITSKEISLEEIKLQIGVDSPEIEEILKKRVQPNGTLVTYESRGCDICHETGYVGRMVVSEVLNVDEDIRHMIQQETSLDDILKVAREKGMKTMLEDGLEKVLDGKTTLEELLSVTRE
jgi:type IV pilus assembly protein PilB